MPSGAKKRKAAKKKMVQQTINNPNSSIGEDEVRNFDEKDSDGGDVSSPASQEHRSPKHPFGEGGEEEVEKREDSGSSAQLIDPKKKPGEEGVVQVEWDVKSEDFKSRDISIESSNKGPGRSSSSSSSSSSDSTTSSSDDESRVVEKKIVEVETSPAVDLVKPAESLSAVLTTVGEIDNGAAVETEHVVGSINPDNGVAHLVQPEKVAVIEEVQVIESTSIDSPVAYSVVDLGLQENVERNAVVSTLDETNTVVLDALDSDTEVHKHKHVPSLNDSNVCTSNAAEHVNDSQSPECSDRPGQPLIATAPQTVQRTSFKSCCGLFDLFTGTNG